MDNLHKTLLTKTTENIHKRILTEQEHNKTHLENMSNAIDRVFSDVIKSFSEHAITSVAESGYNKYTLYTFEYPQYIEQGNSRFPLVFLFKGPRFDKGDGFGEQFFENKGVDSIMKRLSLHFNPLSVNLVNIKKNKQYQVQLIW